MDWKKGIVRLALPGLLVLWVGWLTHPYLRATANVSPYTLKDSATTEPSTRPETPLRQYRGQEGFWRLAEDTTGVWWFLSPDGHREFLNTVTTVQPEQDSREKNGPHFVSRDWDKGDTDADLDNWAAATLRRVTDAGFKGLGAWCNPAFHKLDVPMTQDLNLWTWVSDASKRLYSPDWQELAEQAAKAQVAGLRNNRNLVGYFIDNEVDWGDGFAGPGAYFDHLPAADPNRLEVLKVVRSTWPTLAVFNAEWDAHVADWSELSAWPALPREPARAYSRLGSAWLSHLAHDYFRVTTALIHRYDPHHLILGVRFKGYAPEEVVSASRDFTDAQSLNYYVDDAQLDPDMFRMMYHKSGQPIIISEYSFHSIDGHSGDPDTVGFSAQVPDQQARADGYRLMTSHLARVPYIVGADWFQWCDEPPGGRSGDGEDVNFGIVDIHDKPYNLLVDAVRQTAPTLDNLHVASADDDDKGVWRESYANKPVMHVPFLDKPPLLDGNLSQWPRDAHMANIRRDQTVGLDRRPVNLPNVYIGWTNSGLYLAIESFDKPIQTAPASGWWWTRDHAEFWLSTRPVASDQVGYDVYCHQFFFVPEDGPAKAGVVGQWHRDGDNLKDNLIPQPDVKAVERILPDRYIVEMFLPARALHGYDPIHQPALQFNVLVRNFAAAADFFWSAPKFVQTQLRPTTWGTLYLDAPPPPATVARTAQATAN